MPGRVGAGAVWRGEGTLASPLWSIISLAVRCFSVAVWRGDACVALVEHHKPGRVLVFWGSVERGRLRRPLVEFPLDSALQYGSQAILLLVVWAYQRSHPHP